MMTKATERPASEAVLDATRGADGVYRARAELGTRLLWNEVHPANACQPNGLTPDYEAQAILRWIEEEHIQALEGAQ